MRKISFAGLFIIAICLMTSCGNNSNTNTQDEAFAKSQERVNTNRLMKAVNGEELDSTELALSEDPNAPKHHFSEFTYFDKDMHLLCIKDDKPYTGIVWSSDEKSLKITFIKGEMKSLEIFYPVDNISIKTIYNNGEQTQIMCKNGLKVQDFEIPALSQKIEESGVAKEFEAKVEKIMTREVDSRTKFTKEK